MLLAIVALVVITFGEAKWTSVTVLESKVSSAILLDMHMAPLNKTIHILTRNSSLFYLYILPPEGQVRVQLISCSSSFPQSKILSSDDGKQILTFVTCFFNGKIGPAFIESVDYGNSWKLATVVNLGTDYRFFLDALLIPGSGRVIALFRDVATIKIATRPPGSMVFSPERTIKNMFTNESFVNAKLAYNTYSNKPVLHLFYATDKSIYYSKSLNMGATWTDWVLLFRTTNKPIHSLSNIGANSFSSPEVMIAFKMANSTISEIMLIASDNYGTVFLPAIKMTNRSVPLNYSENYLSISVEGDDDFPIMPALIPTNEANSNGVEFTFWDIDNLIPTEKATPFQPFNIIYSKMASLSDRARSKIEAAVAVVSCEKDGYSLMLATYSEFYPEQKKKTMKIPKTN